MIYNYYKEVCNSVREFIKEHYTHCELIERLKESKNDFEADLYDDCFVSDNVTGSNASGSFFCNSQKAAECVAGNWDILANAVEEFGNHENPFRKGEEWADVTIRCYVLNECVHDVVEELYDKYEDDILAEDNDEDDSDSDDEFETAK